MLYHIRKQLRSWRQKKCKKYTVIRRCVRNKIGLEIGGPSNIFVREGLIPIYPFVQRLDNCNFASKTFWNGPVADGRKYIYDHSSEPGQRWIAEATSLDRIRDETYDFVLASHVLEHIANPIRGLMTWKRVLKKDGVILLILPQKEATFDHRRKVTAFEHLCDDFQAGASEDDLTHLEEILKLHDLTRDPPAGTGEQFYERSLKNAENRCLHHHVFDKELTVKMFEFLSMMVVHLAVENSSHIVVLARKVKSYEPSIHQRNAAWISTGRR